MAVDARAVIARQSAQPAPVEAVSLDNPGPGEILVRLLASGVCHTDLHIKLGNIVPDETFPWILGHEGSGIVEEVGPGVTAPQVGDYVAIAWRAPCGTCRFCQLGQLHLCAASLNAQPRLQTKDGLRPTQVLGIGSFATHCVVAARQAIGLPRAVPPGPASLIGCGVMTGVGAALNTAGVRRSSTVAVFGAGGVGTSVIQGARLARARKIIAVDIDQRKLDWAVPFGATDLVNASQTDPVEAIKELTGGFGVDYSFEAVGHPEVLQQALGCRDLAGVCTLIGVPSTGATLRLDLPLYFSRGGSLRVSWYGDCLPSRDFPLLAHWYLTGELLLDQLITREISLDETEDAFAGMERGETLKTVIKLADR